MEGEPLKQLIKSYANYVDAYVIKQNYDYPIHFGGPEGAGKSTLVGELLFDWWETNKGEEFPIKKLLAADIGGMWKAIKAAKKLGPATPAWLDEAGRMFFSREAMKKANVLLTKMFIINRAWRLVYAIAIPSVSYLDKYLREWRIKTSIYVYHDWRRPKERLYAYYSKRRYYNMIFTKKLEQFMPLPEKFIRKFRPNFLERFGHGRGIMKEQKHAGRSKRFKELWELYEEIITKSKCGIMDEIEEEIQQQSEKADDTIYKMNPQEKLAMLYHRFKISKTFIRFTPSTVKTFLGYDFEQYDQLKNLLLDKGLLLKTDTGKNTYRLTNEAQHQLDLIK